MHPSDHQDLIYICVVFGVILLPGTLWAITRQHKFKLSQLMLGMLTFCAVLVPLKNFLIDAQQEPYVFFFVAICLVPLISGGILVGIANEAVFPPEQRLMRWLYFLAGLSCPLAIGPFVISSFGLLALFSRQSGASAAQGWWIAAIWLVCFASIGTTAHRKIFMRAPSSKSK